MWRRKPQESPSQWMVVGCPQGMEIDGDPYVCIVHAGSRLIKTSRARKYYSCHAEVHHKEEHQSVYFLPLRPKCCPTPWKDNWVRMLRLGFQCVGILNADLGTSPLYVFSNTFKYNVGLEDDMSAVLFLIIYSFLLFAMVKIIFIVLLYLGMEGTEDPLETSSGCRWVCRWQPLSTVLTKLVPRTCTSSLSRESRGA
ncbi:uncharacterized protein LOC119292963 [Triticum dicoccoides]|uniref:uncharacterized protein LOC119292963 n=1 Tax=Triticum dicoccoides TaxID=85692 RepID=UPI00188FA949|nr:uncharacterized protein LOC119292963 [Triticum dicoccoides]